MISPTVRSRLLVPLATVPLLLSAGCVGSSAGVYASDTYGPSFYDPYRADTGGWSSRFGLSPYRDGFDFGYGRHGHK